MIPLRREGTGSSLRERWGGGRGLLCDTGFLGDPLHPNKRLPTLEPQFCWGGELRDQTECLRGRLGRYGLTDFEFDTIFGTGPEAS